MLRIATPARLAQFLSRFQYLYLVGLFFSVLQDHASLLKLPQLSGQISAGNPDHIDGLINSSVSR